MLTACFEMQKTNSILTWFLECRLLLMFFGCSAIFAPLTVLADFYTIFRSFVVLGLAQLAFL